MIIENLKDMLSVYHINLNLQVLRAIKKSFYK